VRQNINGNKLQNWHRPLRSGELSTRYRHLKCFAIHDKNKSEVPDEYGWNWETDESLYQEDLYRHTNDLSPDDTFYYLIAKLLRDVPPSHLLNLQRRSSEITSPTQESMCLEQSVLVG